MIAEDLEKAYELKGHLFPGNFRMQPGDPMQFKREIGFFDTEGLLPLILRMYKVLLDEGLPEPVSMSVMKDPVTRLNQCL